MGDQLREAIGATDSLQERAFCLALMDEGPDAIARILRRYLDLRDGRATIPEWALRVVGGFGHRWESPPDYWLDRTTWSPGACAHRRSISEPPCGVHALVHWQGSEMGGSDDV